MFTHLKTLMPRGLYGRALLILVVPVVTIQLVVSIAFIQRHFDRVTRQMSAGAALEVQLLLRQIAQSPMEVAQQTARDLQFTLRVPAGLPQQSLAVEPFDFTGKVVIDVVRETLPKMASADLISVPGEAHFFFETPKGVAEIGMSRKRVSATNPHQLLVLMIATSVLMTVIAYLFLRNQIRPITKLAEVAEAFGKGRHQPYRPRGATEVRVAGAAFLDMRARIERQIEQRTLMLSGVSHDLRTPLTRLRLGLAMLPEDEETAALLGDVADMERLVDEFLAFARGDATEDVAPVDLAALLHHVVENAQRGGQEVALQAEGSLVLPLRAAAITRAVENLLGNAKRFGTLTRVTLTGFERSARITVEDNGPGIPGAQRDEAMAPFARLDTARDPNKGGGVGLGLSIAADIARSHGGSLRLSESEDLGGLRADLILAR